MKIYTRTGDKGTTTDLLGSRVSKSDIKIELQGSIDEINAALGYLRALLKDIAIKESSYDIDSALREIQHTLFRIGGDVSSDFKYHYVKEEDISFLEQSIDTMTNETGALQSFIYYSGNEAASFCQLARSISRRAERVFVKYLENKEYNLDYQYINRLSDFLFSLARYINFLSDIPDEEMKLKS